MTNRVNNTTVPDSIVEKIQKLLALAQSPNEHEASLAMEMANKLLLKHNLDMAAVMASEQADNTAAEVVSESFDLGTKGGVWSRDLANVLCDHNFCKMLISGGSRRRLFFVGTRTNVAVTRDLLMWMTLQILRLASASQKDRPDHEDAFSWHTAFCKGCVSRISDRLREQREQQKRTESGCTALVLTSRRAIDEFIANKYGKLRMASRSRESFGSHDAYQAGRAAGGRVHLSIQRHIADNAPKQLR